MVYSRAVRTADVGGVCIEDAVTVFVAEYVQQLCVFIVVERTA